MMKNKLYILLAGLIVITACSKEELEPSVMTLLTANSTKSWQTVDIITDGDNDYPCRNDDIFVFTLFDEDLGLPAWEIQDNFISCDFGNESTYLTDAGFWRLNNQQNRLTLTSGTPTDGDNINYIYYIEEITETSLRLRVDTEDEYGFQLKREYLIFREL